MVSCGEGEAAVPIKYAFLRRGVRVQVPFFVHQSDVFRSGAWRSRLWNQVLNSVFGSLWPNICKVTSFVAVAAGFSWSVAYIYITGMSLFAATQEAGCIGLVSRSGSTRKFLERFFGVIKCLQYNGHVLLWLEQRKICLLWTHRCWCQKNNIPMLGLKMIWFCTFRLLVMCLFGGDEVVHSFGEFVLIAGFLYPSS